MQKEDLLAYHPACVFLQEEDLLAYHPACVLLPKEGLLAYHAARQHDVITPPPPPLKHPLISTSTKHCGQWEKHAQTRN